MGTLCVMVYEQKVEKTKDRKWFAWWEFFRPFVSSFLFFNLLLFRPFVIDSCAICITQKRYVQRSESDTVE